MTIRMGYADSSGGQIHFRKVAGSGVPVVFLHQTASSGKMWVKMMEAMAGDGRTLVALDTPGFGGSFDPPADSKPSITQYGAWLREALADMGITRCHLVGHHTGSCIAVELAARHPELAASLIMLGPVPLTPEERLEFSRHFGTPFQPNVSGSYLLENWEYLRNLGAHTDPMLINREMSDQLRAWWGRVQSYSAVWDQDFTGFYMAVKAPIMIAAAPEDVLRPYLARAAELRPDALVLDVTGHNFEPDLDTATLVAGLRGFIAE